MADAPQKTDPPGKQLAGAMLARGLEVTEPSRLDEPAMEELEVLFPEYEFTGVINRGGFGTVYRAQHRRLNRAMAVKVLTAKMSWDETTRRRFEREMKIAGQLDHPGVVRTFDAGERDGAWFLAMEFLDGADLSTVSRECGPLPVAEACEMIRQAALGLHYAHEQGLIHRDVKPGNLMLARHPDGTAAVKVLDFGIARAANPEAADLTVTQQFLGTLNYCAPEQIEHPGAVDLRADVFALGLTLHRLLTGATPRDPSVGSSSLFERIRKLAQDAVPSVALARPELPAELVAVVERMVALDPDKRFPNCAEAAAALAPFCAGGDLAALLGRVPVSKTAGELTPSASRSKSKSSEAVELSLPAGLRQHGVGRLAWAGFGVIVLLAGWWAVQTKPREDSPPVAKINQAGRKQSSGPIFGVDGELAPARAPAGTTAKLPPELKIAQNWRLARVFTADTPRSPRYFPRNNEIILGSRASEIAAISLNEPATRRVIIDAPAPNLSVSPDQRFLAWAKPDLETKTIGRWDLNTGKLLPDLKIPNDPGVEPAKLQLKGMAFMPPDWSPAGNSIQPGVLRNGDALATVTGDGLHRFRMDSDQPPDRVATFLNSAFNTRDLTFTRDQIYVTANNTAVPRTSARKSARPGSEGAGSVWRVQGAGFEECQMDKAVTFGHAIAGDWVTGELFVFTDTRGRQGTDDCHVLRLVPDGGPGRFTVHEILAGAAGAMPSGLALSPDRRRLLVCDTSANLIYELERPDEDAPKTAPLLTREQEKTIGLSPAESPVLAAAGWRLARFIPVKSLEAAVFGPKDGTIYFATTTKQISAISSNGVQRKISITDPIQVKMLAVSSDDRRLAWAPMHTPDGIGRLNLDGSAPASVLACPADSLAGGSLLAPAFVPAGWSPGANSLAPNLLRAEDVLVVISAQASRPGLYRFRFEAEEVPELVVPLNVGAGTRAYLKDLAFTRDQLYGVKWLDLHRMNPLQSTDENTASVWRFAGTGLRACQTDRLISTAMAMTADPQTGELFVLSEASKKGGNLLPPEQTDCLWHLKPDGGPDKFTAQLVLHGLKGVSGRAGGLSLSPDGRRLLLCDRKASVIYELQRP